MSTVIYIHSIDNESERYQFITSNHPACLLSNADQVLLLLMPISPSKVVLVFNREMVVITPCLNSLNDLDLINNIVASNAKDCIYSKYPITDNFIKILRNKDIQKMKFVHSKLSDKKLDISTRDLSALPLVLIPSFLRIKGIHDSLKHKIFINLKFFIKLLSRFRQ